MDDDNEAKREAGKIGGAKRAKALAPDRRAEIARDAANARWGKAVRASHKGNFLADFGVDVDCYVLDDATKTAVISQRGMGQAIGFGRRGSQLMVFVNSKTMEDYIGRVLRGEKSKILLFFNLPARPLQTRLQPERTDTTPRS